MRVARPQHGFTLVEVLTAVTVLGLVLGPLTTAAVLFLQHGADATNSFADDGTMRAATAMFVADAQSAGTVSAPDASPCGDSGPALWTIAWDDGGTSYRASWFAEAVAGSTALVRRRCTGTELVSTIVLGDVAAAPAVACVPACAAPAVLTMSGTTARGAPFTITARRRST